MSRLFLFLLFGCAEFGQHVESARILGVFPVAGKSVNILYNKLMTGLADAGHDVTVISAFENKRKIKNGSLTDVILTGFEEKYDVLLASMDMYNTPIQSPIWASHYMQKVFLHINNNTFWHPNVRKFLKEKNEFDLVISEYFWNDALSEFAAIYNCPLVIFTSMGGVNPWLGQMVGNPMPISYVPHFHANKDAFRDMGFFPRLHNFFYYLYDPIHNYFVGWPDHNELIREALKDIPEIAKNVQDVAELYYNPSLILLGSHSSIRQAVPVAPNVVEIGGFHIEPPKKLPKDLQDFLDGATDGVIYFSMGSHLESKSFSEEKKKIFLEVFRKTKLKVLWKFEDDLLPGKSDNVLIKKWLPQMDILAHPNVKLFLSHGGYASTLETVYNGKPSLMVPVLIDQLGNAQEATHQGYALTIPYNDENFSEATLSSMINEMVTNPKYAERAKSISEVFHDRPMKPLDTAIYWIEYVIRHKGADHLKLAGRLLPWYKFYMVDVLVFLISVIFIVIYLPIRLVKGLFTPKKSSKTKVKRN
ncbi:unnamed protein product [Ceutorhynchus assimilis]|uniref:UDP-glucuronosyltransferase n=1 Tax=Ceutorhynchus assimilis TaxID=467358 RepID=A0A9N9MS47_9CUCU|nr:unnamed protein product [Ceutorhynchus assimilis]